MSALQQAAQALLDAWEGGDLAAAIRQLAAAMPEAGQHDDALRKAAAEKYGCEGEIEIDDDAIVSSSEAGAYVAAWIWVYNSDAGLPDPDDDDETSDAYEAGAEAAMFHAGEGESI